MGGQGKKRQREHQAKRKEYRTKKRKREAEEYRQWVAAGPPTKQAKTSRSGKVLQAPTLLPVAKKSSSAVEIVSFVAENRAFVYPEAGKRLKEQDAGTDLLLGINCCGVCAAEKLAQQCPRCKMVWYCGNDHAVRDTILHREVCAALDLIRSDEEKRKTLDSATAGAIAGVFGASLGSAWVQYAEEEEDEESEEEENQDKLEMARLVPKDMVSAWRSIFMHSVEQNGAVLSEMILGSPAVTADTSQQLAAALDPYRSSIGRWLTGLLSYPLTLAEMLRKQPHCFGRTRGQSGELLWHLAGAAVAESSLPPLAWAPVALEAARAFGTEKFVLVLLGNDLHEEKVVDVAVPVPADDEMDDGEEPRVVNLRLVFIQGTYCAETVAKAHARADVAADAVPHTIVGFHMGLTVAEYDWTPALAYMNAMKPPPALFSTCFTMHEANLERNLLVDEELFNCLWEPMQNLAFTSADCKQSASMANDVIRANKYTCLYRPTAVHRARKTQ